MTLKDGLASSTAGPATVRRLGVVIPGMPVATALRLRDAERSAVRLPRLHWPGRLAPLALALLGVLAGCQDNSGVTRGMKAVGDAQAGKAAIAAIGCGTCHTIPGVAGADGLVGPPLDHMKNRVFLAGMLRNTPSNMVTWLTDPQSVVPGNAMPDMRISPQQAQDIAAYLYTLD